VAGAEAPVRLAALLRLTALGIALMGWLDPASTIAPAPPIHVQAAIVRSARDAMPGADGTPVLSRMQLLADELSEAVGNEGTVRVHEVETGGPLPCDAVGPCLVFTDGAALSIPSDRKGPISLVLVHEPLTPNVEVVAVTAPPAHLQGAARAQVRLAGQGVAGAVSRVRLNEGSTVVGEVTHEWDADEDVALDVPWWPIAAGSRRLVAHVTTEGVEERTTLDNDLSADVLVTAEAWPVLVWERRPSWAATFIRRALEGDRRFAVESQTDVAPRITVTSRGGTDGGELDGARVVVVGAPDALDARDVARLDRFARVRGGAVVLAPDRGLTGPVQALLGHTWRMQLDDQPSDAGPLRGTEWLIASGLTPLDTVWASSARGPTVVATPTGAGVVLVSGVLDAWRRRGDDGAFDRFWRGTVSALAMAVGDVVSLQVAAADGAGRPDTGLRLRASGATGGSWRASATHVCDDRAPRALRLWPADGEGTFLARLPERHDHDCRIVAEVQNVGRAELPMARAAEADAGARWTPAHMQAIAVRTGGVVIEDGRVDALVGSWLEARSTERRPEPRYPMRAWWWVLPLVGCLGGEWWLRRRSGLR
jgi:hypothetical protein